jgi:hypothetical protein
MRLRSIVAATGLVALAGLAWADLQPWQDYDVSEEVHLVTTVKVDSNMEDAYLEGLKRTWIPGNEIAMKLGHIKDYAIYRSQMSDSGDFNLILVVTLASAADLQPNKARYDEFMQAYGEKESEESTEYAQKNYPAMREITGEYLMREVTIK